MAHEWVAAFPDAFVSSFEADDPEIATKGIERGRTECLRQQLMAIGSGDIDAFTAAMHPDIEFEIHCPEEFPFIRRSKGREQVTAAVIHNFGAVESQAPKILRVVAQGDVVDLLMSETGRIKDSGQAYDVICMQQYVFRDDKIYRVIEVVSFRAPSE